MFKFSYCGRVVYDLRIVEPDIDRECREFEKGIAESRGALSGDVEADFETSLPGRAATEVLETRHNGHQVAGFPTSLDPENGKPGGT